MGIGNLVCLLHTVPAVDLQMLFNNNDNAKDGLGIDLVMRMLVCVILSVMAATSSPLLSPHLAQESLCTQDYGPEASFMEGQQIASVL